jgi:hypothetical protein
MERFLFLLRLAANCISQADLEPSNELSNELANQLTPFIINSFNISLAVGCSAQK